MASKRSYINIYAILKVVGAMISVTGAAMIAATVVSLLYGEDDFFSLLFSSLICIFVGLFFRYIFKEKVEKNNFRKRDGYITVALSWIVIAAASTMPFLIYGVIPSFTDAFFETMSGYTTTGATIIDDIEALPHGLLFWRSMTHWIGGIGIIVLSIAILPIMGIGSNQLYAAESTGPTKDKFHPRIVETAKTLCTIYIFLTFTQTFLLWMGDMNLFDAVCHSFSSISTGGFSTKNNSVIGYSAYSHYIIMIFMFLGGVNFGLFYFLYSKQYDKLKKSSEFKGYFVITIAAGLFLALILFLTHTQGTVEMIFRNAMFTVISIITTTGFISSDYSIWAYSSNVFVFLLMFVGACAGSTSGGIKVSRHVLMFKNIFVAFKQLIHPRAVLPLRYNGKIISQNVITGVLAFFFLYIVIFFGGAFAMALMGYKLDTALSMSATSLGNIGPAIGEFCSTCSYAPAPVAAKWIMSFLMLVGRLELFTVIIIFTPAFWKK